MKIILDTFYDLDEDIFEGHLDPKFIGGTWMYLLYQKAQEKGIRVMLGTTYLKEQEFSAEDLILSETFTANTQRLLQSGARPFLLYSFESPNVDWKFFMRIYQHAEHYPHAYLFCGAAPYLPAQTKLHPFYWTNDIKDIEKAKQLPLTKRNELLVMIASNKKQNSTVGGNVILGMVKSVMMKILTKAIPVLRLKDLYAVRMQVIRDFSSKPWFKLYGKGWNATGNLNAGEKEAVKRLQPQPVNSKNVIMRRYTFAICFENCVYKGYITEKIFDCFFAGCIPVYYGAPDIADQIPPATFIDASAFKDMDALGDFLNNMTDDEIDTYRKNILQFIRSPDIYKFTDQYFSTTVLTLATGEPPAL